MSALGIGSRTAASSSSSASAVDIMPWKKSSAATVRVPRVLRATMVAPSVAAASTIRRRGRHARGCRRKCRACGSDNARCGARRSSAARPAVRRSPDGGRPHGARRRRSSKRASVTPELAEFGDAIDVDEMARPGEPKRHGGHEALPTRQHAAVLGRHLPERRQRRFDSWARDGTRAQVSSRPVTLPKVTGCKRGDDPCGWIANACRCTNDAKAQTREVKPVSAYAPRKPNSPCRAKCPRAAAHLRVDHKASLHAFAGDKCRPATRPPQQA